MSSKRNKSEESNKRIEEAEPRSPYDCEDIAVATEKAARSGRWIHCIGYVDGENITTHCTTNEFPVVEFPQFLELIKQNLMRCLNWDVQSKSVGSPEAASAQKDLEGFTEKSKDVRIGKLPVK